MARCITLLPFKGSSTFLPSPEGSLVQEEEAKASTIIRDKEGFIWICGFIWLDKSR